MILLDFEPPYLLLLRSPSLPHPFCARAALDVYRGTDGGWFRVDNPDGIAPASGGLLTTEMILERESVRIDVAAMTYSAAGQAYFFDLDTERYARVV